MSVIVADGREVARRVMIARGFWGRFRGLMGRRPDALPHGSALVIDPCSSIHMFFMRFPIDVLYLDQENRVVRAQKDLRPWRIGPLYTRGACYVVELPAGTIERVGVCVGDEIIIHIDGAS